MKQSDVDIAILYAWAGLPETIESGYRSVCYNDGQPISQAQAKKRVHAALKRANYDPHTSHKLINAWVELHRYFAKNGGQLT
jgi:hypothetical protein